MSFPAAHAVAADEHLTKSRRQFRDLPPPLPCAGIDAYNRERELALARDPRTRENYERFIASGRRGVAVDYLPTRLDIENASRCNFRCTMCIVSDWHKGKRAEDMKLDEFKSLIDAQYGLVEIKLNGLGEALMQGNDYFEIIRYARSKHIWVWMVTNGSLLHLRDNYRKLVDSGVNEVHISIDGADKDTYEGIRRGSVFEKVVKNCMMLNGYFREKGLERTRMWTVIQEANYQQLPELLELADRMGFRNVGFSLNLHGWGHEHLLEKNKAVEVENRLDPETLFDLVDMGERLGIKIRFWSVGDKYDSANPERLCPWPFERALVTSDLRVVPCCMIGDPDAFEIGAKSGKSLTELWSGPEYEEFRRAHLTGDIPNVCKNCYRRDDH